MAAVCREPFPLISKSNWQFDEWPAHPGFFSHSNSARWASIGTCAIVATLTLLTMSDPSPWRLGLFGQHSGFGPDKCVIGVSLTEQGSSRRFGIERSNSLVRLAADKVAANPSKERLSEFKWLLENQNWIDPFRMLELASGKDLGKRWLVPRLNQKNLKASNEVPIRGIDVRLYQLDYDRENSSLRCQTVIGNATQ